MRKKKKKQRQQQQQANEIVEMLNFISRLEPQINICIY